MKSKSFMLMILSMGFGLVAAIGISQVMGRGSGPAAAVAATGPVVVAAKDLEHNSFLSEENVTLENWPVEIIPENAATSLDQIKEMACRAALSKGMPVMLVHVVSQKTIGDINIPEGQTVMAIKVAEDDTFAGLLKPGDKVNVLGHFRTADRSGMVSKTFLKGLRVWSVNSQMTIQPGSREENSSRGSAIVGVLVTERQAEAINFVQKTGSLKLVLRGDHIEAGDDDDLDMSLFGMSDGHPKAQPDPTELEPQPNRSAAAAFSNLFSGGAETSMVVWNGTEPLKTTFKNGALPESAYSRTSPSRTSPSRSSQNFGGQAAPAGPAASAGQAVSEGQSSDSASVDSPGIDDSDRGLEEDQYPGE